MTVPPVEVGGARAANARTPTGGPVRCAAEHAPADEDAPPASSSAPSPADATEQDGERVRMALAEAGYPDARVRVESESLGFPRVRVDSSVPVRIVWRAFVVARAPARCWACMAADHSGLRQDPLLCLARGEGVEDCGVERSAS